MALLCKGASDRAESLAWIADETAAASGISAELGEADDALGDLDQSFVFSSVGIWS